MKTTRYITFADKIFAISDLRRIAMILNRQVSVESGRGGRVKYAVTFEDGHRIEGSAAEVFAEEELNRPSRPFKIEIWLHSSMDYINVQIRSGDPTSRYENSVTISGEDASWVDANYTAFQDAIAKVAPQSFWWRRHRTLLLNLIAFGVGALELALCRGVVLATVKAWPDLPDPIGNSLSPSFWHALVGFTDFLQSWPWRWVLGISWALLIRRWLLSMWPSIEFNFGSPSLRPDSRRQKLNWVLTVVVIPIIVAAVYDLLKDSQR